MFYEQSKYRGASCVDIQKMNKGELTDISSMKLDPSVPQELRAAYMLKEMGNPYCFRVGDLGVKVEFLDNAPPLQDALSDSSSAKKRAVILSLSSGHFVQRWSHP